MYICQSCGAQVGAGIPALSLTVSTRQKTYPERWMPGSDGRKPKCVDFGGVGREIVREIKVCEACGPD